MALEIVLRNVCMSLILLSLAEGGVIGIGSDWVWVSSFINSIVSDSVSLFSHILRVASICKDLSFSFKRAFA